MTCAVSKNTTYKHTNTNESRHSGMGQVWQNPIQRTVKTAHLSVLMTVHNFSTQYNIAQMLSIGGKWGNSVTGKQVNHYNITFHYW